MLTAVPYFHSVQPSKDSAWIRNYLSVSIECFEMFLIHLRSNGWTTVFLDEMYRLKKSGDAKGKYCVITFDDGYVDNYIFVYPLLQKYQMKGTIFVSPECVDNTRDKAELFHADLSSKDPGEYSITAYLNWDEIKEMQDSGVIDIQSHTMTHTKYFTSAKIVSFHHPGSDSIYAITNRFPDTRQRYFSTENFEQLIPYGSPIFEQKSAVLTRIHQVSNDFEQEIVAGLKRDSWSNDMDFEAHFEKIKRIYKDYLARKAIFSWIENDQDFNVRLRYEIADSKKVLEKMLGKPVEFLCWPHGENDERAHSVALESGYLATTSGKSGASGKRQDRFERFGVRMQKNKFISKLHWRYKLNSSVGLFPDYLLKKLYEGIRYGVW